MDWERIRFLMYMGSKTPEPKMAETQTILEIMGSPITDKEKLNKIKSIDGGNAYTELVNKYGSYLRMGVVNYYYNIEQTKESQIEKPLFAIKSNILFDIATLINVEIEVPIGKRISVAAETMFPQWNLKKQKKTIEAVTGNLELKVWLGNRQKRQHMVGWYVGAYGGGGGKYTLMLNQNHG